MKTVCLDSGHYGKTNACPNNKNYYESVVMWELTKLQKKYLEGYGIKVVTTRDSLDKDLGVTSRGMKAKNCDLFVSNHSNAVGWTMNDNVDYVLVYHLVDDSKTKCDDISKEIANIIAPEITKIMGVKQAPIITSKKSDGDRNGDGELNDNYLGVLHGARSVGVPAILIEHSFHTNNAVVEWLLKKENLEVLAKREAECIATYLLGELPKQEQPNKDEEKHTNSLTVTIPTITFGSNNKAVGLAQYTISSLGIELGNIDCDFGPKTLNGVKEFQKRFGLYVDGIVGIKTWTEIFKLYGKE